MSTRITLALLGAVIIVSLGVLLLRRSPGGPSTYEAPSSGALPPVIPPSADPALHLPTDVPPAPGTPAPSLPPSSNPPIANPPSTPQQNPTTGDAAIPPASTVTIRITASGFSPAAVTVDKDTRVTFRNESAGDSWPASAMHPTHRAYPESDILKCGTAEKNTIFDACGGIAPGASWSFTFTEKGSWKYHDHLSPARTGTIMVE